MVKDLENETKESILFLSPIMIPAIYLSSKISEFLIAHSVDDTPVIPMLFTTMINAYTITYATNEIMPRVYGFFKRKSSSKTLNRMVHK